MHTWVWWSCAVSRCKRLRCFRRHGCLVWGHWELLGRLIRLMHSHGNICVVESCRWCWQVMHTCPGHFVFCWCVFFWLRKGMSQWLRRSFCGHRSFILEGKRISLKYKNLLKKYEKNPKNAERHHINSYAPPFWQGFGIKTYRIGFRLTAAK